jgi:hypothetical protein
MCFHTSDIEGLDKATATGPREDSDNAETQDSLRVGKYQKFTIIRKGEVR